MSATNTVITAARILLALLLTCGVACAQTHCTLDGGNLSFGEYRPTSPGNVDVLGLVTLRCNGNFQVQLSMSVGNGSGASYAGGRLLQGPDGNQLRYNLYTDASRTLVLGDGTNGSVTLTLVGKNTLNQVLWGRIPGGQPHIPAGIYIDTLVATVSY